jgi:dTDP-4-amino-4,6-dideoxygalactose transaminase
MPEASVKGSRAMQVPFVDLKAQYAALKTEIDAAVQDVMSRAAFILGDEVEAFEREFAAALGSRHLIGVASGTDALHLALRALGVGPGDEVVTVPNTYIATVLAITFTGAKPVFVDADERTFQMNVSKLSAAIGSKTKAVIPVHLTGAAVPMDAVIEVASEAGIEVVEDAAQAHLARWRGRAVGTIGRLGAFSFYPGKNLGAYGDGGAVATDDDDLAANLRMLRNMGQPAKYDHRVVGWNSRLDGLQAAVLRVKLPHLEEWNEARRRAAVLYDELLAGTGDVRTPEVPEGATPIYHLYMIRTARRDGLARHLGERGVATGIHYPVPVHLTPAYANLGYSRGDFPVAERLADEVLSLPMYPEITKEAARYVAGAVRDFFDAGA